jgi:hypothetical protein
VNVAVLGPQFVKSRQTTAGHAAHVGVALVSPGQTQQFVPSIATGSLATMLTTAGRLVGGGGEGTMAIFTGSETVKAPSLSVAFAVSA